MSVTWERADGAWTSVTKAVEEPISQSRIQERNKTMPYGCDSFSNSFPCGADFYVGELNAANAFNTAAAATVGAGNTFAYYFLYGPSSAPPGVDAYTWGVQQADGAYTGWNSNNQVARRTIFGDVEGNVGDFGWVADQRQNQLVWEGYAAELGNQGLYPGLYSTQALWNGIMGAGYTIGGGTPVWSADNQTTGPCGSCPGGLPSLPTIGGVAPTIWQYDSTPSCANDLDFAASLPG